ncbi:hypothetical protein BDQ12DRAFT_684016 [Crucibulum laeve]|uniref:Uncharacterized protein n=1 Tax=Crucibulum laeve TaxID=68775 RepID=A0A5C3MAF3_9AGAR|nr:hypothetical protein BDQ12DRAFT_684016 [Crucibulum laeve]
MRWTAPPDRREISLVLFALTVFLLAYNLEASLELLGVDPEASRSVVFNRIVLGRTKVLGKDGRKPHAWRDPLERDIYGDFGWDEGHAAGDGEERSQPKGNGRHGAMWIGREAVGPLLGPKLGKTTVDQGLIWWSEDIPKTSVVKHVPGFSVMDNVFLMNGTLYFVTDDVASFPNLEEIVVCLGTGYAEWEVISTTEARKKLGGYGGFIRGVSFIANDFDSHNSTLLALWRTYASLDPSIDASGRTTLATPERLIIPHKRFFTDANPEFSEYWIRRARYDTGYHPYTAKAAFPYLTTLYFEDLEDYMHIAVPWLLERVVISDRQAASGSHLLEAGQPVYSPPFKLEASEHWWEPVRLSMAKFFGVEDEGRWDKKVVTYLHNQAAERGARLETANHEALVKALREMGKWHGYEVNVVATTTLETDWNERMEAIVKSTVVLGPYGHHLFDTMFMRRTPHSTLMEFFPEETFVRDEELVVGSIGLKYVAWWNSRKFTTDDLPPVGDSGHDRGAIKVDTDAVVRAVHEILSSS